MTTLTQALEKLSVCITPSTKYARPLVRVHDGMLYAYNGINAGCSPFRASFPSEPLVVDADSLRRVWCDDARATVKDNMLTVRTRRTSYSIRILDDVFDCPELTPGGETITRDQRTAILTAAKFSSVNAEHPWACGVLLHNGRAVASNNISIVSVQCGSTIDTTLPFWAVQALNASREPPRVRVAHTGITFTYDDGTCIHSAPVGVPMPEKLFELIEALGDGDVSLQPVKDAAADALRIPGRRVTIDPRAATMTVETDLGNKSVTDIDLSQDASPVIVQEPMLRLILENATHIGFADAPNRLLFSSNAEPPFHGVAACMVM